MALCDRVVSVVATLCTANDVAPLNSDFVPGLDVDDLAGYWGLEARFAGNVCVVDVADWKA